MNMFIQKVRAQLQDTTGGGGTTDTTGRVIDNPLGPTVNTISDLIVKILNLIVQVGLPIIVIMIIYTGFKYVMARGNETKIKEAHNAILWTVIGAAVILGAAVTSKAICNTVNSLGASNTCN